MSDLVPELEDDFGDDVVESLLPVEEDTLDPAEEFDALSTALEETPDVDDLVIPEEEPPLGRSWAFDFETGRFRAASSVTAHGPLATHGLRTLETWIEKCLRTDRGAHPVHSANFGVANPFEMIGQPVMSGLPDDYDERIRTALTMHPHIADIRRFKAEVDPNDDVVLVSFMVVLMDDTALPFETKLGTL